jgi:hypothetical protein
MQPPLISRSIPFLYTLVGFNILFLSYVLIVGYYNRLSLDDFAYMGVLRDYGLLNPFTFWYDNWQGRFAPQLFLNIMFSFYQLTSNLIFYPIILSSIFVYSFYQILHYCFKLPKLVLLNYSILLYSALLLTTFELSTFYWLNASVMYFGGVAFLLLGLVFILKNKPTLWHYIIIAICFLYAGSSSENFGALACLILMVGLLFWYIRSAYNFENFTSHFKYFCFHTITKKIVTGLFFCSVAFIVMILSPGTSVRMAQGQHMTDPFALLNLSLDSTLVVYTHIFYKLPYIIVYAPLFVLFGCYLNLEKIIKIRLLPVLILTSAALFFIIFISNIPLSYALGQVGPLRSYVFVSFFLVAKLFLVCVYIGSRYQAVLGRSVRKISGVFLFMLFLLLVYTLYSEVPLLRKYSQSDKQRIATLDKYKRLNRTEPVFVSPLYNPEYLTVTDLWRKVTNTENLRAYMTDMPVMVGEISETSHWRNGHLKHGLDLKFEVYLAPNSKQSK